MENMLFLFFQRGCILFKEIFPSQINSKALQLAGVAKIIRSEIFQVEKTFEFADKFPPNCQTDCVPYSLNLLISMILYGPMKNTTTIHRVASQYLN